MNIFAYTPHVIMPPYISINEREDGKVYITVRSQGSKDVSEIEIPGEEIEHLCDSLMRYIVEMDIKDNV